MRFVEVLLICTLSIHCLGAPLRPYKQVFVFGDSYSDIGEGYLDGNGPTAVAYMAQDLGIELVPSTKSQSPAQSLDFAISGAQTGRGDGKRLGNALLGVGMQNQVDDFIKRLKEERIRFNAATTLFYLAGGLNDRNLPTQTTVSNLEQEIQTLYSSGARRFLIALMPTAIPAFSDVGLRLNPALASIPAQIKQQLPNAEISLSHWGSFFDEVINHPAQYGIRNTLDACAGREIFKENPKPCATPDAYYYYHAGHPSTAVHKLVGAKLADEIKAHLL